MARANNPPPVEAVDPAEEVTRKQRRSRSRPAGSLGDYQTRKGRRWKFQIYVLIDPEKPELGEKRLTRGGFTDLEEAQAALTEALKKRARNEKFQGKTPTVGVFAPVGRFHDQGVPEPHHSRPREDQDRQAHSHPYRRALPPVGAIRPQGRVRQGATIVGKQHPQGACRARRDVRRRDR